MTHDEELQQRLSRYLARRAPVPPHGLLEDLLRETADAPQRRRRATLRSFAWWGLGAAAAVTVLVVALLVRAGLPPAPGPEPGTQATPSPSAAESLTQISLPMPVKEKAIAEQALAVFEDRLRTLGIGDFTSSAGDTLQFSFVLPPTVNAADVDLVLHTAGRVEWLAWPDSLVPPAEGDPVPTDVLPLFDAASQITSVKLTTSNGQPAVDLTFGPVATEAIATYTSGHVNQTMPLAMDGQILLAPIIQSPITSSDLVISMASQPGPISAPALAAILSSGPVPEGWTMP